MDCLDWRGMQMHRALLVPTPFVFANHFNWVFKGRLGSPIFTTAKNGLAVRTALRLLRTPIERAHGNSLVVYRDQILKPLLVALFPSVVLPIHSMNIEKTVYELSHDIPAVIIAWEMMRAVDWSATLHPSAAQ